MQDLEQKKRYRSAHVVKQSSRETSFLQAHRLMETQIVDQVKLSKELRKVDWSQFELAIGTADRVPKAILALTSADNATRQAAYWQLDNHVIVQSDLYSAAYQVIPFLLNILSSNCLHGRDFVYKLLFEIGNGAAPKGQVIETFDGSIAPLEEACRNAVLQGVDMYVKDLNNIDSSVRLNDLELLGSLTECKAQIMPRLQRRAIEEQDATIRAKITAIVEEFSE